jgi:hypothetical protein
MKTKLENSEKPVNSLLDVRLKFPHEIKRYKRQELEVWLKWQSACLVSGKS